MWKKVAINLLELFGAEMARGTVLQESLVPSLDLLIGELCILAKILQHFRLQFAVLFAHLVG